MTAKEFLESQGYEFPDKDFWMEDYTTEHKVKDLVDLMERYSQSQKSKAIELLYESKLQLEYLDKKFQSTGTTAQVLSEIDTYLIETKSKEG